jgi:hypothetical protein
MSDDVTKLAGDAMDEAVALALGWQRLDGPALHGGPRPYGRHQWLTPDGRYAERPPRYHADPAAMVGLLDALRYRGWRVYRLRDAGGTGPWECDLDHTDSDRRAYAEGCATMPEAVARAALIALESERPACEGGAGGG